jgi:hypothetical protein
VLVPLGCGGFSGAWAVSWAVRNRYRYSGTDAVAIFRVNTTQAPISEHVYQVPQTTVLPGYGQ